MLLAQAITDYQFSNWAAFSNRRVPYVIFRLLNSLKNLADPKK